MIQRVVIVLCTASLLALGKSLRRQNLLLLDKFNNGDHKVGPFRKAERH